MKIKKVFFSFLLALLMILSSATHSFASEKDDIIILFESDVHCAIDGYTKLAAMKEELSKTNKHVGVVSLGDFIQGGPYGSFSKGEYIINIMNKIGYDAITVGNHEFDYKIPRLMELNDMLNTKIICSNFRKANETKTVFEPYKIVSYGDTDIAYIGIVTPDTLTSSTFTFSDENNNYIYTFDGNNLSSVMQKYIDSAKEEGADYIVVLSHLGTEYVEEKWNAKTLVKNTEGIDIILDGHSHVNIENMTLLDKAGNEVIISSLGEKFENIGKVTISDGEISTELIPTASYERTSPILDEYISKVKEEYSSLGDRKVGFSEVFLTTVDEDGNRIIRNEETNLGDFLADAFRIVTGADLAFMNGGGIRANLDKGDVTYNDLLSVIPWSNTVVTARVTGRQIADMLELGAIYAPGENGSFQHVSGIAFDLNLSIPSSVKLDDNAMFLSVDGPRRVSNIKILNKDTNEYEPINMEKTYILASHNHLLIDLGGGASMFKDAEIVLNSGMTDLELLEIYVADFIGGVIGEEYAESQNRINVIYDNNPDTSDTSESSEEAEKPFVPSDFFTHTVIKGDTLWDISKAKGCTIKDIVYLNKIIKNPNLILIGWELMLPKK